VFLSRKVTPKEIMKQKKVMSNAGVLDWESAVFYLRYTF